MPDAEIGPILLSATAAALSARTGGLRRVQVMDLHDEAEALPVGHSLRFAALAFCLAADLHRRNPAALVAIGEALQRDIDRALRPDVPGHDRSDIHG